MSNVHLHRDICEELTSTYLKKNLDYGNSFGKQFEEYGLISSAIRIEDKLQRLKNTLRNAVNNQEVYNSSDIPVSVIEENMNVQDEKIEDTLLDMANYCIMTVMELRGQRNDS